MTESNKSDQPRPHDSSTNQAPEELDDLEAADADIKGGGVSSSAGTSDPGDGYRR